MDGARPSQDLLNTACAGTASVSTESNGGEIQRLIDLFGLSFESASRDATTVDVSSWHYFGVQCGSRPMKPSNLDCASAPSGTATGVPY